MMRKVPVISVPFQKCPRRDPRTPSHSLIEKNWHPTNACESSAGDFRHTLFGLRVLLPPAIFGIPCTCRTVFRHERLTVKCQLCCWNCIIAFGSAAAQSFRELQGIVTFHAQKRVGSTRRGDIFNTVLLCKYFRLSGLASDMILHPPRMTVPICEGWQNCMGCALFGMVLIKQILSAQAFLKCVW